MKLIESPPLSLPDHTQLPESDGTFVKNFQEHPQSILLTDSLRPILQEIHPDGHYQIKSQKSMSIANFIETIS